MIMQARADERQRLAEARSAAVPSNSRTTLPTNQQDTYWSSLSKAVSERTQKLGTVQDSMDSLAESSSNLANEAHKFVQQQKKNAVMGGRATLLCVSLGLWGVHDG